MLLLNVTASGWTGFLNDPSKSVAVTFYSETINDTVTATSRVSHAEVWPSQFSLNVICDIYIDPSARLNLTIHSDVGQITMNASTRMTFEELNLETTTGNVDADLRQGTTVAGNISINTTTGNVRFRMDKANVSRNVSVNLQSTTGSVNMDLIENQRLSGNVTVNARTTTGSVNLSMIIDDDVGASIESSTVIGGINEDVENFSGNETLLESDNFPAGSNFLVTLRTSTGGINIDAVYEASAVRS
jgi:predicted membrane protein